jgi:hypothetical protein
MATVDDGGVDIANILMTGILDPTRCEKHRLYPVGGV